MLNENKRHKSLGTAYCILSEREGKSETERHIYIIYYVYIWAYIFFTKRKALRTNQKLINKAAYRE